MNKLTSGKVNLAEVGQLLIPVGTIGPVFVKIGDSIFIPADRFRAMAKGVDISTMESRRAFIGSTVFDDVLSSKGLGYYEFFALTDEEVHTLYADCRVLKGVLH